MQILPIVFPRTCLHIDRGFFFFNAEGSNTNNLQVGKYPIIRDEGGGGSFLFLSFNMYHDFDFRLNTGDHPCSI